MSRNSDILRPSNQCAAIIEDAGRVAKGQPVRFSVFEHILLLERRITELEETLGGEARDVPA